VLPLNTPSAISAHWRRLERQNLALELKFSYRSGDVVYIGTGRTRNFSGEMLCFEVDQSTLRKGTMELRILWPVRLQNICQLELVVTGQLVRTETSAAVLRMESREFQTLGTTSFNQLPSCGVTCNLAA
jgi:hypothetical protein